MTCIKICNLNDILYRLKYLPLNGFLSSPCIRFDANEYLNYLSYPVLIQLAYKILTSINVDSVNILGYK